MGRTKQVARLFCAGPRADRQPQQQHMEQEEQQHMDEEARQEQEEQHEQEQQQQQASPEDAWSDMCAKMLEYGLGLNDYE